jgi:hypothetical protein
MKHAQQTGFSQRVQDRLGETTLTLRLLIVGADYRGNVLRGFNQ